MSPVGPRFVRNSIDRAFVQFRLHRTNEAKASLDSALSLLDVTRGRLMTSDERDSIRNAVDQLRRCMDRSTAPPLATLTVHTYEEDDAWRTAEGRPLRPAPSCASTSRQWDAPVLGAFLAVQRRRGRCESLLIPPNESGEAFLELQPRGAGTVSMVLHSSKEVTEETPLIVVEARGGMLSAAERTFTLKCIAPAVSIRGIDQIDLLGPQGNLEVDLTPLFSIADGAMVAVDAAKVIGIVRAHSARTLVLLVQAWEKEGVTNAEQD